MKNQESTKGVVASPRPPDLASCTNRGSGRSRIGRPTLLYELILRAKQQVSRDEVERLADELAKEERPPLPDI